MALFQYNALDPLGKILNGTLEAVTVQDAIGKLKAMGYFVTGVFPQKGTATETAAKAEAAPTKVKKKKAATGMGMNIPLLGGNKIPGKELTVITRQLATLIGAGLPLLRALRVLEQQRKGVSAKILGKISVEIEQGALFSEALTKFPGSFQKIYIAMVRAGEAGGALESVLSRLADFMETEAKLKGKIKSAMAYPIVIVTVATGIVTFIMLKIVPVFVKIFNDFNVDLPAPTKLLMAISNLFVNRWYYLLAGVIGLVILFKILNKIKTTRFMIDKVKLHMPVFGPVVSKTIIARFARTFATLITSGVPILQSLQIVRDTVGNEVIAKGLNEVRNRVREGEGVSGVMLKTEVFPPMVTNMIAVGEETGAMDAMLEKVAEAYEAEVDAAVTAMTSMIEPILIVFMGVIVGFIVLSLFLPLIRLAMSLENSGSG